MKKGLKKLIMLAVAGIVIAMCFLMTGCGSTVNLNKYCILKFSGYEGFGKAIADFDMEAYLKDFTGKIKLTKQGQEEYGTYLDDEEIAECFLYDCVTDVNLSQTENLSNGDVVILSFECDNEKAKKYFEGSIKSENVEYVVSGLEEVETFNPFEDIDITKSGISPNGDLTVKSRKYSSMEYNVDNNGKLANGDTTIIYIDMNEPEYYVDKFGGIPEKYEMEYDVDGLAHYVSKLSEIPQDVYEKMDKQLQDAFDAHVASSWDTTCEAVDSKELVGNYLLTLKDGMSGTPHNYLYYIYKIIYSNNKVTDFTYYWYGYYKDVIILEDGTCSVDLSSYTISESSSFWGITSGDYLKITGDSSHYVAGFADLDSLFNQHVTARIEKYNYESTVEK